MLCKALEIYSKGSGGPEDALQQESDMIRCAYRKDLFSISV